MGWRGTNDSVNVFLNNRHKMPSLSNVTLETYIENLRRTSIDRKPGK